jgi:serpin B
LEEEGISIQSAELMPSKKASAIANDNINSSPDPSTDKDALAILNSAAFDSAWATPYSNTDIVKGAFYSHDGSEHECLYMLSTEEAYLNDGSAVGFVKPYADGKHSFAALMPNENIRIDEYIRGLNGDKLLEALQGATQETLLVEVPKFSATTKADMNGALQSLGITDAFDPGKASFSGQSGGIYIGEIVNTATISIDECGYMAVKHGSKNGISVSKDKYIKLDKPFVYMVIDNETNIPLIIGICLLAG